MVYRQQYDITSKKRKNSWNVPLFHTSIFLAFSEYSFSLVMFSQYFEVGLQRVASGYCKRNDGNQRAHQGIISILVPSIFPGNLMVLYGFIMWAMWVIPHLPGEGC